SGTLTSSGSVLFSNIQSLVGNSNTDSFTLGTSGNVTSLDGGAGANTLSGANAASTWSITGTNAGTVTSSGAIVFSSIQSLIGNSNADSFTLGTSGNVASLDGGAGTNTLTGAN